MFRTLMTATLIVFKELKSFMETFISPKPIETMKELSERFLKKFSFFRGYTEGVDNYICLTHQKYSLVI